MTAYLLIFLTGFAKNGVKAFQQDNINRRHWNRITPTSMCLSAMDVLWVGGVVEIWNTQGVLGVVLGILLLGLGSGWGTQLSMWVHDR